MGLIQPECLVQSARRSKWQMVSVARCLKHAEETGLLISGVERGTTPRKTLEPKHHAASVSCSRFEVHPSEGATLRPCSPRVTMHHAAARLCHVLAAILAGSRPSLLIGLAIPPRPPTHLHRSNFNRLDRLSRA